MEARFAAGCWPAGFPPEGGLAEANRAGVGVLHAHNGNIATPAQIDPASPPPGGWARLPEQLGLASGRPVLIVPYAGRFDTVGRRALDAANRPGETSPSLHPSLSPHLLARELGHRPPGPRPVQDAPQQTPTE